MITDKTRTSIEEMLAEGKTKAEIFQRLGGTDDNARVIAATPYLEDRKKYNHLNNILFGIMLYYAAARVILTLANIIANGASIFLIAPALAVSVAAVLLAMFVRKFYGEAYLGVGSMGLAAFINGSNLPASSFGGGAAAISLLFQIPILAGVILAFVLKKRLCPTLGFMGAKKDATGKYQFLTHNQADSPDLNAVR